MNHLSLGTGGFEVHRWYCRAYHCIVRLCHLRLFRLAYHYLPALLCCGCHLLWFAMVQTLMIVVRKVLNLQDYITTIGHIEAMNKVIVLRVVLGCAYLTELFIAWYGQNPTNGLPFKENRATCSAPMAGATG